MLELDVGAGRVPRVEDRPDAGPHQVDGFSPAAPLGPGMAAVAEGVEGELGPGAVGAGQGRQGEGRGARPPGAEAAAHCSPAFMLTKSSDERSAGPDSGSRSPTWMPPRVTSW